MRRRAALMLLLAAGAAGPGACADLRTQPASGAVVETERATYEVGEIAGLRLNNPLDETAGFNACTWQLERLGDEGWHTAPHEDERVCTMELRMLGPGETATPEFGLDDRLPAGRYRLRAVLHGRASGERSVHVSEAFHIER